MRDNSTLRNSLPLLIFFFLSTSDCLAQETKAFSSQHSQRAAVLRQNQNISLATQEYIKSLLLDITNAQALLGLRELGNKPNRLTTAQSTLINRFAGLIDFLDFLATRIQSLESDNTSLIEFIAKNSDNADVLGLPDLAQISIPPQNIENLASFPQLTLFFKKPDDNFHLVAINEKLARQKDQTIGLLENLQRVNKQLRESKRSVILVIQKDKGGSSKNRMTEQLIQLEQGLNEKNRQVRKQEKILDVLSNQLLDVRKEFDEVKAKLSETDQRVISLTRDLAGMSLATYEKERLIADKETRVQTLATELYDANQRLSLVQKIMAEKDEAIKDLETQVDVIQTGFKNKSSDPNLNNLAQSFTELQQKMERESAKNHAHVNKLAHNFHELQKQYLVLEKNMQIKDTQIADLDTNLFAKERKLFQMQQSSLSKDQKLMELSGILEIYRSKLAEIYRILEQKNEILNQLEEKLTYIDENFESNNETNILNHSVIKAISQQGSPLYPLTSENIYQRTTNEIQRFLQ